MFSLNVPVPTAVARLAADLARDLPAARARPRGEHTLVCKRLGEASTRHAVEARVREDVTGQPPMAARVTGVDHFADPPTGSAPVVYLTVESPGLRALHERLCEALGAVDGLEGEAYTPHVTIARGGDEARASRLASREIDPVEWTIEDLVFHDADRTLAAGRISLPA